MKKGSILITGGAGFVGSNLAVSIKKKYPKRDIICFDNLVRQGSTINVRRIQASGIRFVRGDVRSPKDLGRLQGIGLIIDCSAEPSVLAAYEDPQYAIDTNLIGTVNCLNLAKLQKADFIFLSSSRVYPIEPLESLSFEKKSDRFDWRKDLKGTGISYQGLTHEFPLTGYRSLYGATKLSGEVLALEYGRMYGLKVVVNRLGLISGPWQMGKIDQGLVGYWVIRHFFGKPLSYIGYGGDGRQVRDAIHVDDVCDLIQYQMQDLTHWDQSVLNVGGGRQNSFSLKELTALVQSVTGIVHPLGSVPATREGDLRIYITDNGPLIKKAGGFKPRRDLPTLVEDIHQWLKAHEAQLRPVFNKM